ncbi:hypothetical protein FLX35_10190 [Cylindrospermopsis raciborskii LB2897]|jgi:predicted GTPase|uniref:hypothetical protein n=1 Tax=Cylindrospermopsis raciborskii TaxID=77022 RepID=UPI001454BF03|nr:hypothetical protein [Cylindrospermopsis raciborskii]MBG0743686.1 hypothetical protein [Cylindrospermopsis raciborskii KL1]NLQ07909.1 hypothetical protein [Cylindrospermopsis raciborskii LB2897]
MSYTFDIIGVSPVLHFFNHQQRSLQRSLIGPQNQQVEYLGTQICTLDEFLQSVESVVNIKSWNLDEVINTVIQFWLNNPDTIQYWKARLKDAGKDNLLVARLADIRALQAEFESLLGHPW